MGTTRQPQPSSISGSTTVTAKSGVGDLGGRIVDVGSVYNSVGDSGGVMAAANDRNNGNIGAGVTDTADPSKAGKVDISAKKLDEVIKRGDEIRASNMSNEDKKIAISELLTGEGIPHDPGSLDPKFNYDKFGLLSNRVNVISATSSAAAAAAAAPAASSGAISASDAVTGAANGGTIAAVQDAVAADAAASAADLAGGSLGGDSDLAGDVDTIASTVASEATGGLKAGDVVTDDRIVGDYEFVYDADNSVFHYAPFDENGNRIYTGETLDASTVGGFDSNAATTGATKSVTFDPLTGEASIEQVGDASDDTKDTDTKDTGGDDTSGITITLGGDGLLGGSSVIDTSVMGPFQTQEEEDQAAATNAAIAAATGDTFNTAADTNNTGETLTVGGDDTFNTAADTNNTGETLTTGGGGDGTDTGGTSTSGDDDGGGGDGGDGVDTGVTTNTVTGGTGNDTGGGVVTGNPTETTVINGKDGTDGSDGSDGSDGTDGTDGTDGNDGADGADGEDGKAGRNGVSLGSSPIAGGFFDTVFEIEDVLQPELLHLAKLIYS